MQSDMFVFYEVRKHKGDAVSSDKAEFLCGGEKNVYNKHGGIEEEQWQELYFCVQLP